MRNQGGHVARPYSDHLVRVFHPIFYLHLAKFCRSADTSLCLVIVTNDQREMATILVGAGYMSALFCISRFCIWRVKTWTETPMQEERL